MHKNGIWVFQLSGHFGENNFILNGCVASTWCIANMPFLGPTSANIIRYLALHEDICHAKWWQTPVYVNNEFWQWSRQQKDDIFFSLRQTKNIETSSKYENRWVSLSHWTCDGCYGMAYTGQLSLTISQLIIKTNLYSTVSWKWIRGVAW